MNLIFSNLEIIWSESQFSYGIIFFLLAWFVFIAASFISYKRKYYITFSSSTLSFLIFFYVGWIGTGCNSSLKMKINTFKKNAIIKDNLSKSEFKINQSDFLGFLKKEISKREQKKTVTYYHILLLLKNGASFKLKDTTDFSERNTTFEQLKKEIDIPIFEKIKEIPIEKLNYEKPNFDDLCNIHFEKIQIEKGDNSCKLSWNLKMPGYFYIIIAACLTGFCIWLDSVIKEGFSKGHFIALLFISVFLFSFGYLGLQRWNSKLVLILEESKITSYLETTVFGKHRESSISIPKLKVIDSEIETMQDSMTLSNTYLDSLDGIEEVYKTVTSAAYMTFPVYGLPVVDKLRLCDLINKMR